MQWMNTNYSCDLGADGKWTYTIEGQEPVGPFDTDREAMQHLEDAIKDARAGHREAQQRF